MPLNFPRLYRALCGVLHALLDAAGTGFIAGAYDKAIHTLSDPDFPLALPPPYARTTDAMF